MIRRCLYGFVEMMGGCNKFYFVLKFILYLNVFHFVLSSVLEDHVRIDIKWPGELRKDLDYFNEETSALQIMSVDKENYYCLLPSTLNENKPDDIINYKGPSPFHLLKPLFADVRCSYRIEHFWTYELCHGHFLRQYHEDSAPEWTVRQEYILGKFDPANYILEGQKSKSSGSTASQKFPTVRVDDKELPYWSMNLTEGSVCDLNSKLRFTQVFYVCHEHGTHEIYSFKETSTCEYEVIVLSSLLCKHPAFRPKGVQESSIYCHSVDNSPAVPKRLQIFKEASEKSTASSSTSKNKSLEIPKREIPVKKVAPRDEKLIQDVLNGDYCLRGGSGWWRYEFCYGKKVQQYHEDTSGTRTTILLGIWNLKKHLLWVEKNPHKKPKITKTLRHVSHMYSDGDFCEEVGKKRQVEVKLKCKDDANHPNSVSLYLMEPRTCEYILNVESPIICALLETSLEDGLSNQLYGMKEEKSP